MCFCLFAGSGFSCAVLAVRRRDFRFDLLGSCVPSLLLVVVVVLVMLVVLVLVLLLVVVVVVLLRVVVQGVLFLLTSCCSLLVDRNQRNERQCWL